MKPDSLKSKIPFPNYIYLLICVSAFIIIELLVSNGITKNFDAKVLLILRRPENNNISILSPWLLDCFKDITALGNVTIIVLVSIFTLLYFIIGKKGLLSLLFAIPVIGGGISDIVLKEIFARQRPVVVSHLVSVYSYSFPSGHAVMSIVVYYTLAYITVRRIKNKALKIYINYAALFFVFIIGLSRILLGVHYPTDIMGGWCLGAAWLLFFKIISYNKID